jgi:hypothetical protein
VVGNLAPVNLLPGLVCTSGHRFWLVLLPRNWFGSPGAGIVRGNSLNEADWAERRRFGARAFWRVLPLLTLIIMLCLIPVSRADPLIVWGNNDNNQTNVPANVTNVVAMAAGDRHCLALRADGTVVAWGANYSGQTNVPYDLTNVVCIAAGSTHSLALRSDGTVAIWGHIFGSGVNTVPPEATNVVALALGPGAEHALILRADGTVLDWGNGYYGLTNSQPTARGVVAVAAGAFHSLAIRSDGRVVAWGDNSMGQLDVPASATNIVAIAAGLV